MTLQRAMQHAPLLKGVLTRSEQHAAAAFIQAPEDYFDAEPTFKQSYAPQSGEIFGILRQMKETFEANLSNSQKEEAESQKAYEDLKAAKEEEIKAGQDQIDAKTQELADTDEKNAKAKEDVVDTKESLAADEEFLMMLKEKCSMTDNEWEERQKSDQIAKIKDLEMQIDALTKAIDTLKAEIAEMQVQMKRAGEDREKENKEFQTTVADQRATAKLLKATLTI